MECCGQFISAHKHYVNVCTVLGHEFARYHYAGDKNSSIAEKILIFF